MARKPKNDEAAKNETILDFAAQAMAAKRELDECNGKYRAILKAAGAAGINTKALIFAINQRKHESDKIIAEMRDAVQYTSLIATKIEQLDLFGGFNSDVNEKAKRRMEAAEATDAGFAAGKNGVPVDDNPHDPGSELYVFWRAAWGDGLKAAEAALIQGEEIAPAKRGRRKKTAEATLEAEGEHLGLAH